MRVTKVSAVPDNESWVARASDCFRGLIAAASIEYDPTRWTSSPVGCADAVVGRDDFEAEEALLVLEARNDGRRYRWRTRSGSVCVRFEGTDIANYTTAPGDSKYTEKWRYVDARFELQLSYEHPRLNVFERLASALSVKWICQRSAFCERSFELGPNSGLTTAGARDGAQHLLAVVERRG